jgi:hypothetical protein
MPIALRSLRSRGLLCLLAFALWGAATMGLLHRTLPGAPAKPPLAAAASGHAGAGHGVASLFGFHTDAECRLYDQLSHGAAAPCPPLVFLPVLLPAASFVWLEGEVFARRIALFDARGPPSAR